MQAVVDEFAQLATTVGTPLRRLWPFSSTTAPELTEELQRRPDWLLVKQVNEPFEYPYSTAAHYSTKIRLDPGLRQLNTQLHPRPTDRQPGASLSKSLVLTAPAKGLYVIERERRFMGSSKKQTEKTLVAAV